MTPAPRRKPHAQPPAPRPVPMPRVSHITGLYLISSVCGLVDAVCFLALGGVFAEILTGNLLFLCFAIGTGRSIFGYAKYLAVIAAFAVGAVIGGQILRRGRHESRIGFAVEWLLLVAALLLTALLHPGPSGATRNIVIVLLALAMGLQNALIRTHGVPDLATNVMTLTVTALIAETVVARGRHERWGRRCGSVTIFLTSAAFGAFLTRIFGPAAPLLLAVAIFTIALFGLVPRDDAI